MNVIHTLNIAKSAEKFVSPRCRRHHRHRHWHQPSTANGTQVKRCWNQTATNKKRKKSHKLIITFMDDDDDGNNDDDMCGGMSESMHLFKICIHAYSHTYVSAGVCV